MLRTKFSYQYIVDMCLNNEGISQLTKLVQKTLHKTEKYILIISENKKNGKIDKLN